MDVNYVMQMIRIPHVTSSPRQSCCSLWRVHWDWSSTFLTPTDPESPRAQAAQRFSPSSAGKQRRARAPPPSSPPSHIHHSSNYCQPSSTLKTFLGNADSPHSFALIMLHFFFRNSPSCLFPPSLQVHFFGTCESTLKVTKKRTPSMRYVTVAYVRPQSYQAEHDDTAKPVHTVQTTITWAHVLRFYSGIFTPYCIKIKNICTDVKGMWINATAC